MKKLSKLTLRNLESKELSKRQMNQVVGGWNSCSCGCCAADGGTNTLANGAANCKGNLYSSDNCTGEVNIFGCQ